MCGKVVGKGIVVFSLAFSFGIAASEFFVPEQSSGINVTTNNQVLAPVLEKNCVPADKNLSYQNLPLREPNIDFPEKAESSGPLVIKSDEKKSVKKTAKSDETPAEKQKLKKMTEPHQYIPQKDSAEYQTLLHKEQCFETQKQK
jgi:hypothetical protein